MLGINLTKIYINKSSLWSIALTLCRLLGCESRYLTGIFEIIASNQDSVLTFSVKSLNY